MARDETIIEVFPTHGVIRGRLDPHVFKVASLLPDKKEWFRGTLRFALTQGNLELVQDKLGNATWKHHHDAPARVEARKLEPVPVDFEFARPPRQGQAEAFAKLSQLDAGALFMDMGTGKSYVAIHLAAWWWKQGLIDRVILMAPNTVERQWYHEQLPNNAPRWFRWDGCIFKEGKADAERWVSEVQRDGTCHWLFLNIEAMQGLGKTSRGLAICRQFMKGGYTLVIVDESTRIKSSTSQRSRNVTKLQTGSAKRLILSGRPTTKGLEDLFAQFRFLDSSIIGTDSVTTFRSRYVVRGGEYNKIIGYQNTEDLLARMEPHTFTMKKTSEYPPVHMIRHHDLNKEQQRLYKELRDDLFTWVGKAKQLYDEHKGLEYGVACNNAAISLMRMQQVACGYLQDKDDEYARRVAVLNMNRAELTADLIEEAGQEQTLVFCAYRPCIELVQRELKRRDISYVEVSGRTTGQQRIDNLASFKKGNVQVMVGTAASGGIGLDLSMASLTIYYSNTNRGEDREQSKARTDRIGQKVYEQGRGVTYIDIIGSPVCQKIIDNNEAKKSIGDLVMGLDERDLEL